MSYSSPSPSEAYSNSNWSSNISNDFSDCSSSKRSTKVAIDSLQHSTTPPPASPAPHPASTCQTQTGGQHVSGPVQAAARRKRYAAEDDWRRHRDRITTLYKDKRLKDVIAHMESEFHFFATERMYKARFKDWGLQKNVTAAEVHKLMQKVEQQQQQQQSSIGHNDAVTLSMLEIGDNVDVKRIQKYMKRKPVGLRKLRTDPHRPLEVLRALAQDGWCGSGPASAAASRTLPMPVFMPLHHYQKQYPPLSLNWTPLGSDLPNEIIRLLRGFIDEHCGLASQYSSPMSSYAPMSPATHCLDATAYNALFARDELMLDFAFNFRVAHSLLDEGYIRQGIHTLNLCFDRLSTILHEGRPIILFYILSAALEASLEFSRPEVMQMLFHHLTLSTSFLGHVLPITEIAERFGRLSIDDQASVLKVARQLCRAGDTTEEPAFRIYSHVVDMATDASLHTPQDRLQALRILASETAVQRSQLMTLWMELRIALTLYDLGRQSEAEAALQRHYPVIYALGSRAPDRIMLMLKGFAVRIEFHRIASNLVAAEKLAGDAAQMADVTWGSDDVLTRKFVIETDALVRERTSISQYQTRIGMEDDVLKWPAQSLPTVTPWSGGWQGAEYGMGECGMYESSY